MGAETRSAPSSRSPRPAAVPNRSVFPIQNFFGAGAVVNPVIVSLSGSPLNPAIGTIDTLLERAPGSVTFNGIPETHTFGVTIKGLRLKGQTTIDGVTYDLVVALSEIASGPGTITATRLTPDGGRFSSSFPVLPKLVRTGTTGTTGTGTISSPSTAKATAVAVAVACPAVIQETDPVGTTKKRPSGKDH